MSGPLDEPITAPAPEPVAPVAPVEPIAAPAPVEPVAPVAAPEPVAPAEPVAAPVEPAAPEPSLLESFDADKPPVEPTPAEPAGPFEYAYELPEVITMDDAQRADVHKAFDQFRENPKEGAQTLLDLHAKTMQDYATHLQNEQMRVWNDTRKDWRTQVLADEQLGGAGHNTAMGAVARMRDMLVPETQRPAFNDFLRATGAGDHPAFLRLLHNAARFYDEPPLPPANINPPSDIGRAPKQGRSSLYTHPTSGK